MTSLSFQEAIRGVKEVIEKLTAFPVSDLRDEELITDILAEDSLSLVEYQIALEEKFGVNLETTGFKELDSIQSTATCLTRLASDSDEHPR